MDSQPTPQYQQRIFRIGKAECRAWDNRYNADAIYQTSQLEGNHPMRKVLHMQKCYPETVLRLNNRGSVSTAAPLTNRWHRNPSPYNNNTSPTPRHHHHRVSTSRGSEGAPREASDNTARRWKSDEYQFCRDKMAYNRTKGREAEVDGILTGRSPLEKKLPLFPAKATHQQLLGLVQRPSHPDKPAPKVPKERKWLGNNVGWEGNRGLPTPPAGRNAKDGEVHPWPSSQYPSFAADPAL